MTIYARFLQTVQAHGQKTALEFAEQSMTFAQLHAATLPVLDALGDRRGKHVGLLAPNVPSFVSGFLGILAAGGVAVPLNAMLTPGELLFQANHADLTALLATEPLAQAMQDNGMRCPVHVIETLPHPHGARAACGEAAGADDPAVLLYTSGTTDEPKGVMLSHGNFMANYESFSQVVNFDPAMTSLVVLPLFHVFALTTQLLPCLFDATPMVLFPQFKPKEILAAIERRENLLLMAIPPMYGMLAANIADGVDLGPNLHLCVSGGGPMPRHVQALFEEHFAAELREGYGLTEAAPVVSVNLPGAANKRGTIGPPIPGVEVRVCNDADEALLPGFEGELLVRGDNVMNEYYKNPSLTAATLTPEGWLRTGDLAVLDDAGYIRIAGRKKELIISAGENIHPQEIEEALGQFPHVFAAAVVGVPDELKTEIPKAYLAPHPETPPESIDIAAVRAFLRDRLAPHKIPRQWEVRPVLPQLATGKVDKRALQGGPVEA